MPVLWTEQIRPKKSRLYCFCIFTRSKTLIKQSHSYSDKNKHCATSSGYDWRPEGLFLRSFWWYFLDFSIKIICCGYSRLSLSRIPRGSLKYFEISVPRHISFAELRKIINRTTTFNKWICNLTPEVGDILKILWKRGEIAPQEQFLLFSTIFYYLFFDHHVKTGARISLRYKR